MQLFLFPFPVERAKNGRCYALPLETASSCVVPGWLRGSGDTTIVEGIVEENGTAGKKAMRQNCGRLGVGNFNL